MNGRAHELSANPRRTWGVFAAVSAMGLVIALVWAIPSGDRVTIVLTIWSVFVGVVVSATVLYLSTTPGPNESERWGAPSSGRRAGAGAGWG